MQVDSPENLRNVAVVGHNATGKTTVASALLFAGGVSNRLLRVEDGNTLTDFDAEEIGRNISIGLAPCYVPWQGTKVNLIDCPGYGIFISEINAGLRAADAALLCIDTVSGPQVTSEKIWEFAEEIGLPVAIHLTRADRENADFDRVIEAIHGTLGRTALPVHYPIGNASGLAGVVDLVHLKAVRFERDGNGKGTEGEVPGELAAAVKEWRAKLVEAVAENDEALMESFFESGDLSQEQLESGLRKAILTRSLFPISLSSAAHGIGPSALLDFIVASLPAPTARPYPATDVGGEPIELETSPAAATSALVFKTLHDPHGGKISILRVVSGELTSDTSYWNSQKEEAERVGSLLLLQGKQGEATPKLTTGDIGGVAKLKVTSTGETLCNKNQPLKLQWFEPAVPAMAFAIEPKSKGDEEKIGEAVARLVEEDPSLHAGRDPQTGEYLLSGAGDLHVEIAVAKMKQRYKVEVILHPPKVPYRETIKKAAEGRGRHKKQTGGRGQFADCSITMEPLERGGNFEFVDEIFGGSIPQNYRPAVEKGIVEAAAKGYIAGYPVVDFRIRLQDGQYHDVDSSEMAFKIAGSLAFKDAMTKARPTLLEPIMQVEISTSEEFMGDVMSDLSQRRGKPQGMETKGTNQIVKALVPMAEMLNYAPALRSMTQGRSSFTMDFSHYEEVPKSVQDKIVEEVKRAAEAS